ncbi:MAG: flavodoxin family protein [Gammaproteobacteria bacterium]|nr:MAG: flavodoxin family protein [Gammaproteobacteria bacterium]
MKHLIIYSHLNPKSFTKAVADEVQKVIIAKGDELKFIDLYGDKFNPVLEFADIQYSFMGADAPDDVKKYQDMIDWAENIIFVYPLWWSQMPAMLKGFIDRIFSNGYAYEYTETGAQGLLSGKTAHCIINAGNPNEILQKIGMDSAIKTVNETGIFGFCGMQSKTTIFGNVAMGSNDERVQYLNNIKNII